MIAKSDAKSVPHVVLIPTKKTTEMRRVLHSAADLDYREWCLRWIDLIAARMDQLNPLANVSNL